MGRAIIHVDMDAFFASVEIRDNPHLRGLPVAVCGDSDRSVVAAASYVARDYGIHSAMPLVEAKRRCEELHVVPGRHDVYREVSRQVFAIFEAFTPQIEPLSIDEAFLDVTGSLKLLGSASEIAYAIRQRIERELSLPASAGIAPNKFVAKLASGFAKPNGQLEVKPEDLASFLKPLPIEKMWGVGKKSLPRFRELGLRTFGDLARQSDDHLYSWFGERGPWWAHLARGEDDREVETARASKSIGAEHTFEHDSEDIAFLERYLLRCAIKVGHRLCDAGLAGRIVTLKCKASDFRLVTRRVRLETAVFDPDSIYRAACSKLKELVVELGPLRLIGLSVSDLIEREKRARCLFESLERKRAEGLEDVSRAIDRRFGGGAITRAALLESADDVSNEES